ncbi:MAG: hypothetical protein WC455_05240 [Dehalococcoidia bacterium]|jgi:P pilus assembly chaperone PapD
MSNIKKATIPFLIALVLVLILASPVFAGLRVTNPRIEESVSPGQIKTYTMNVGNTASAPADIAVEVRGLGNYITGPIQAIPAENDSSPYSARQFVTATPASFHLESGQSQDVTITVSVPNDVGDGGRYADIFIYTAPSGGGSIGVSTAVAAQVLLTITGSNLIISGDLTSIDIPQAVSEQLFSAIATIQNTGNYHYKLACNGTVWNSDRSQIVGTSWPTDSIYNLIPTFSRQIAVPLNISQELTPGTYFLDIEAYTQDGILLDTGTKAFVLTDTYTPMKLNPLTIEFFDEGQLSMGQWSMAEDGTLMEKVEASSLTSAVTIDILQETIVQGAGGEPPDPIAVTSLDPLPPPPTGNTTVMAFEFSSEGITFEPKADITLQYSSADIPEGVSETQLRVATVNENLQWIFIDDAVVDTDANTITFSTTHFSVYAILAPSSANAVTTGPEKQIWIWMVIGAIAVVLIAFSINTLQHRRAVAVRREQSRRRRRPQGPKNDEW